MAAIFDSWPTWRAKMELVRNPEPKEAAKIRFPFFEVFTAPARAESVITTIEIPKAAPALV